MNEFTLEIDCLMHWELKNYLLSQPGVLEVNISDSTYFLINIKYNSHLISPKILKMETLLFLDCLNAPCIISFDKHSNHKIKKYNIIIKNLCCEYCLLGMIDDLLMIDGIEQANSHYEDNYNRRENVIISIYYDPTIIKEQEIQKLELRFNS